MNFNEKHPELLPGEAWLTNHWDDDDFVPKGRTLRYGTQAYTTDGVPLRDGKPVFISQEELNERKARYEEVA